MTTVTCSFYPSMTLPKLSDSERRPLCEDTQDLLDRFDEIERDYAAMKKFIRDMQKRAKTRTR